MTRLLGFFVDIAWACIFAILVALVAWYLSMTENFKKAADGLTK